MRKTVSFLAAVLMVSMLGACDMSTPSHVNTSKIRVMEDYATRTFDVHTFTGSAAERVARDVVKNGKGKMDLTLSYSASEDGSHVLARRNIEMFKQEFKNRGVSQVSTTLVPMDDERHVDKLVVSYKTLVAKPPKECTPITGDLGAGNIEEVDSYEFGCESKTAISQMIVDPTDLLGKSDASEMESRRAGATVEQYKTGEPNEPMEGFNASDIGAR